jgi:hypothetical protein
MDEKIFDPLPEPAREPESRPQTSPGSTPGSRRGSAPPHTPYPPRSNARPLAAIAVVLAVAAGFGGAWWWWQRTTPETPAAAATGRPALPPTPTAQADPAPAPVVPIRPLPPLGTSDEHVRELLAGLSSRIELGRWLAAADDLIRRAVAAVASVSEGGSPRGTLAFLAPAESFLVYERGGRHYVDPRAWARYDTLTAVVVSLDTVRLAAAIRELLPLFDEAFTEIAYPGRRFETALVEAIRHLRATPLDRIPADRPLEIEVTRQGVLWVYSDPARENLSAAQKHLLRMGPRNAALVQAKLAELSAALGMETAPR